MNSIPVIWVNMVMVNLSQKVLSLLDGVNSDSLISVLPRNRNNLVSVHQQDVSFNILKQLLDISKSFSLYCTILGNVLNLH